MKSVLLRSSVFVVAAQLAFSVAQAWDYEGHRAINQLALSCLPTNFPAFVLDPAGQERVAFLAGEMDRWRNMQDLPLRHCNGPDHYIDIEELSLYGLKPEGLPVFRYDFVGELAVYRHAHPDKFPEIEAGRNEDHTRGLVGLLPWGIAESYAKLKSCFSYLKTYQEDGGTPDEIANAQANVVYVMGVMGHMVGDASQPLHTTIHHHGWVGANPNNYSTNSRIHSWIDGGYFAKVGGANLGELKTKLRPAQLVNLGDRPAKQEEIFQTAVLFIVAQNKLVEPVYQMEKAGKLSGNGTVGLEGKPFLEGQLLKSGQFLGDLWFSAWQKAPADNFLKSQLARRKRGAE